MAPDDAGRRDGQRLPVTLAELERWLGGALPGEALDYYRGFLALDRVTPGSRLSRRDAEELDWVARAAMGAAEAGRVHLLQRRNGIGDYTYMVVVKRRPAAVRNKVRARETVS